MRAALGLGEGPWPPGPRELLRLPPGDHGAAEVEAAALEQISRLRPLQLAEPDAVTDAMTHVARAVDALTPRPPSAGRQPPVVKPVNIPLEVQAANAPRSPYWEIVRYRRLLAAWDAVGEWLAVPDQPVRLDFGTRLLRWLDLRRQWNEVEPPIPSLVIAVARLPNPVGVERDLVPTQRAKLAAAWQSGRRWLYAHISERRRRLQPPSRRLRRQVRRAMRWAARHPDWVLLLTALVALALAFR